MINTFKLLTELTNAGIKTCGCNSDGVVWDIDKNEIQDRDDVAAVITVHDPSPDAVSVLREKYNKAGINSTDMIFALWKKVMSADSADADSLQVLIDQVDSAIDQ